LKDLGVDGMIILKCFFKEYDDVGLELDMVEDTDR
jgi:hypothetical protein